MNPCNIMNKQSGKDIINGMPDEILIKILSLLETCQVASTSSISKKWKDLWMYMSKLNFCLPDFERMCPSSGDKLTLFEKFVSRTLGSRMCEVKNLRLNCSDIDTRTLEDWISIAGTFPLKQARITTFSDPYSLDSIFRPETLEVLKIFVNFDLFIPQHVHLPRLKVLHIDSHAKNIELTSKFFAGIPKLEYLHLSLLFLKEEIPEARKFEISCPSLKKLRIMFSSPDEDIGEKVVHMTTIDTPVLQKLTIEEENFPDYSFACRMPSLIEALIAINYSSMAGNMATSIRLQHILENLSSAKRLYLNYNIVETLTSVAADHFPKFVNLTHLDLYAGIQFHHWRVLLTLLACSPKLEELCLDLNEYTQDIHNENAEMNMDAYNFHTMQPILSVQSCISDKLRSVRFQIHKDGEAELKWIAFLFQNAKVLEKLVIDFMDGIVPKSSTILSKLSNCSRSSTSCKVLFRSV